MKPITGDQFLQLTAWLSVNNDEVRTLQFKSHEHSMFLGAFSGCLSETLFGNDLDTPKLFEEETFNKAWHVAYLKAKDFMEEFGIDLPDKDDRVRMCGLYIRDILAVLFHYPETEPEDYDAEESISDYEDAVEEEKWEEEYDDSVDETFYNPYTGSDEYESEDI